MLTHPWLVDPQFCDAERLEPFVVDDEADVGDHLAPSDLSPSPEIRDDDERLLLHASSRHPLSVYGSDTVSKSITLDIRFTLLLPSTA